MANNNKHTGPNVPALRFPEFSGEWEQHSLSDYLRFKNGLNPDAKRFGKGIKFISVMDILNNASISYDCVRASVAATEQEISDFEVEYGDVLFQRSSETLEDIGRSNIYVDSRHCVFGGFVIRGKKIGEYEPYFMKYRLDSPYARKSIIVKGAGAQHFNIGQEGLSKVELFFFFYLEQVKIGDLLRIIDDRINTQSKIIEEQETLLRSLRHKIYSRVQAQSQCTIADVLCYEQPTKYLVTDTDYTDDDSQVPVLTANKAFILGYTTENFGIYDKGPCIILDDFTLDCKYVDFKFKVKSSAIKILRAKAKTNLRFIFEYFRFLELNTTEHRRHYIAEIEPMSILLPSNEEIDRIARLFTALDERLETARKELKILESQKMYMLQKMFI